MPLLSDATVDKFDTKVSDFSCSPKAVGHLLTSRVNALHFGRATASQQHANLPPVVQRAVLEPVKQHGGEKWCKYVCQRAPSATCNIRALSA